MRREIRLGYIPTLVLARISGGIGTSRFTRTPSCLGDDFYIHDMLWKTGVVDVCWLFLFLSVKKPERLFSMIPTHQFTPFCSLAFQSRREPSMWPDHHVPSHRPPAQKSSNTYGILFSKRKKEKGKEKKKRVTERGNRQTVYLE